MTSLVVHHHLGLGDHFVCNGLVNYLSESYDSIYLACKKNNFSTVNLLYSDSEKVKVFTISENEDEEVSNFCTFMGLPLLRVGFENCDRFEWNTSFYSQLQYDFKIRYSHFKLPNKIGNEEEVYNLFSKDEYCLVHRESSESKYNLDIDTNLPIVEIEKETDPYGNLLNYRKLIQNAKEVHCVNSSVFHFVDSIDTKAKLVYHDVRKRDFKITDKWSIINYD